MVLPRSKDGIPQWDGEAASFQEYEEQSLQWEQSQAFHKRYLCGPKLIAELSGAARKHVMGKRPDWVSYNGGVSHLLRHLRSCLGRPTIPEMTEYLNKYFRQSRRRRMETMNAYITRKMETYHRARQALSRVEHYYKSHRHGPLRHQWHDWEWNRQQWWDWPDHQSQSETQNSTNNTSQQSGQDEEDEEEQWYDAEATSQSYNWRHSQYGSSSYHHEEDEHWKLNTDELLPEFLQGWYLLVDSGLEASERNLIQTAIQEDFSVDRVSRELRRQWPDDELRRRDQTTKQSGFWQDEQLDYEDEETYDKEIFSMDSLNEEGQILYGEATQEIHEAQAVIQQAKRTLRDARARQHQVRLSRQYYKTSFNSNRGQSSYKNDYKSSQVSNLKCLRCGQAHRTSDCPDKHAPTNRGSAEQSHVVEEAPFVCFTETTSSPEEAMLAAAGAKTTRDAFQH